MPPAELRSPKFAIVYPLFSAAVVGFISSLSYEMQGHVRADVMGVTGGLLWFMAERAAWWSAVAFLGREEYEAIDPRQAIRGMWSKSPTPTVDPYALTISQNSPYYRLQGSTLLISKRYTGDAPWLSLPVDLARRHVEGFYDTVILHSKAPTEKNLAGWGKPFSQLELRTWRDWLYRNNWIYFLRKGENAPWRLTPRGRRVIEYVYRMLQGEPHKAGRWIDYSPTKGVSNGTNANP